MKTPAMGIKLQRKTNIERSPIPGICKAHIPRAVSPVFAAAIRAYIPPNPLSYCHLMRPALKLASIVALLVCYMKF